MQGSEHTQKSVYRVWAVGLFVLVALFLSVPVGAADDTADLTVFYIERTPHYQRYDVLQQPDGSLRLRPGTEQYKRWPDLDELVTYTAVVANYGDVASTATTYLWKVDGQTIASGDLPALAPAEEVTLQYRWRWQDGTHDISLVLDPGGQVTEITTKNNEHLVRTDALSFHIHVEQGFCRLFLTHTTAIGSKSCHDWVHQQVDAFNELLANAKYELTPKGVSIRIVADKITHHPDGDLSPTKPHAPSDMGWDGRWGFPWSDALRVHGNCSDGQCYGTDYVKKYAKKTDWELMREFALALGLLDPALNDVLDREVQVRNDAGDRLPAAGDVPKLQGHTVYLGGCTKTVVPFTYDTDCSKRGIVGDRADHFLSPYDAAALQKNSNFYRRSDSALRGLPKRRGYVGEFQYAIPEENVLRILGADGKALKRARVTVYQSNAFGFDNTPKYRGTTSASGRWTFPDVSESRYGVRISTPNPFTAAIFKNTSGQLLPQFVRVMEPDPNRYNTTLLIEIRTEKDVAYRWLDVTDFNMAAWAGNDTRAEYTIETGLTNVSPTRILVTAPGPGGGPHVRVLTPLGAPLADFMAYDPSFRGGVNVAVGDVDGDGKDEIVTAPGPTGSSQIRVLSNHGVFENSFLAYDSGFRGGVNVAVGDVDGDGKDEIVTAPAGGGGPNVRIFSKRGAQFLPTTENFFAYDSGFRGGVNLTLADMEGDGKWEIITAPASRGGPQLRVFGYRGGVFRPVILGLFAYHPSFSGGVTVQHADLNGDGRREIITGVERNGGPHTRAFAWSSSTKRIGLSHPGFLAFHPAYRGGVSATGLDLNGDAKEEWYTTPRHNAEGVVRTYSSSGARLLDEFLVYDRGFTGGVRIAGGTW